MNPSVQAGETPRTDAVECEIIPSADPNYDGPCRWVEAHFARTLERELTALQSERGAVVEECAKAAEDHFNMVIAPVAATEIAAVIRSLAPQQEDKG